MDRQPGLIVALDVPSLQDALHVATAVAPHVAAVKIGLELAHAASDERPFAALRAAGASQVFYDAKLHDIPNTVAAALRAMQRHELWMVNVHASGGSRMLAAASEAIRQNFDATGHRTLLIAVTLLTSLSAEEVAADLNVGVGPQVLVSRWARMAQDAGADGVVASPLEIETIRGACGKTFLIVTPGVRPRGTQSGDQRRVLTPGEAARRGADYLVVGRPILAAPDPAAAARAIAEEVRGATAG